MDYRSYLNEIGNSRKDSPIRHQYEIFVNSIEVKEPAVWLSGGMPNGSTFPAIRSLFELRDGSTLHLDDGDTAKAMQYLPSPGQKELVDWFIGLQKQVHNPPTYNNHKHPGEMDLCLISGSQHGLALIFENMISKGDFILVESPTYAGAVAALKPLKPNVIIVETDAHGIIPEKLEEKLSRWNPSAIQNPGKDGPKFLYTVPTCGNPAGATLTEERKKRILHLAKEYKFLIIEDDAYFYLKKKPYVRSFLSMDTDGIVVRLDTMSKIISAGIRIGIITGPKPIIAVIRHSIEVSVLNISGLSQEELDVSLTKSWVRLFEFFILALVKKWGYNGFLENTEKLFLFYEQKKKECLSSAEKYLKDVAEWNKPEGGLFLWMKLKVPDSGPIVDMLMKKNIFVAPGSIFSLEKDPTSPYIRVSFSNSTPEKYERAFQAIALAVKEHLTET